MLAAKASIDHLAARLGKQIALDLLWKMREFHCFKSFPEKEIP
jgi:hypothetical protein